MLLLCSLAAVTLSSPPFGGVVGAGLMTGMCHWILSEAILLAVYDISRAVVRCCRLMWSAMTALAVAAERVPHLVLRFRAGDEPVFATPSASDPPQQGDRLLQRRHAIPAVHPGLVSWRATRSAGSPSPSSTSRPSLARSCPAVALPALNSLAANAICPARKSWSSATSIRRCLPLELHVLADGVCGLSMREPCGP
jgi:hypothetical protein